jgi:hypothetical protein
MLQGPDNARNGSDGGAAPFPFAFPASSFAPWAATTAAAAASCNGKVVEGLAMLNREWFDFVSRRFKEDLDLLPRLAACASLEEIAKVHGAFWPKLFDDYWKEFTVMTRLGNGVANGTIVALQSGIAQAAKETGPVSRAA